MRIVVLCEVRCQDVRMLEFESDTPPAYLLDCRDKIINNNVHISRYGYIRVDPLVPYYENPPGIRRNGIGHHPLKSSL
jgi:hypothetical protein